MVWGVHIGLAAWVCEHAAAPGHIAQQGAAASGSQAQQPPTQCLGLLQLPGAEPKVYYSHLASHPRGRGSEIYLSGGLAPHRIAHTAIAVWCGVTYMPWRHWHGGPVQAVMAACDAAAGYLQQRQLLLQLLQLVLHGLHAVPHDPGGMVMPTLDPSGRRECLRGDQGGRPASHGGAMEASAGSRDARVWAACGWVGWRREGTHRG